MTISPETKIVPASTGSFHRAWLPAFVLSLAVALTIISPFFWKGNASGHDFTFHAASWLDAAAQWRDGILLPRWTAGANHGFGEPRFIFYPPLSWMLGAALGFVAPWIYVPPVFIVITQTLAGISAFTLARRLFPRNGALFSAVCYAANPYALLIAYMRSDFAEQLALVFFPLLILAALQITGLIGASVRNKSRSIALLAVCFAAVWLSNAPAGVIASYSLAVIFTWVSIVRKSWRVGFEGAVALGLGFALAGFYLAPAIYEQPWVNISEALSSGLQPSQNFLYAVIADEEHNAFNRIASGTAVLMLILTAMSAWAAYPRDKQWQVHPVANKIWSVFTVLAVTGAFLMLRISAIFWTLLPKLRFVQFPWRWMSMVGVAFACFAGGAISRNKLARHWSIAMIIAMTAILTFAATYMVRHAWWDSEDIPVLQQAIENDEGFEGTDEYDPIGDDHTNLPEKSVRVKLLRGTEKSGAAPDGKIHVEQWFADKKELRVTSRQPLRVALRLLNYPAWRVEVNDAPAIPQRTDEMNQMVVPLAAGSSHVVVRFIRTIDRTVGYAVSASGVLIVLLLFFRRAR